MTSVAQRSFASGELAPSLWPRTDAQAYAAGARLIRNFTVKQIGGLRSRAGFAYVATAGTIAVSATPAPTLLVPWVQSSVLPYLMEFGSRLGTDSYVRFWLHGARVSVGSPAAWLTATAYTSGQVRANGGANYYCFLAHTSGATTQPGVGASWATVWHLLETDILEIPLPYTPLELREVQMVDDGEGTRLLFHALHPAQQIVRVTATEWSIADVVWEVDAALTAPTNPAIANPGSGVSSTFTQYKVCALSGTDEGATSTAVGWNKRPGPLVISNRAPLDFSWTAVVGATGYRVFRSYDSGPYYKVIDVSGVTNYRDIGAVSQTGLTQEPSSDGAAAITTLESVGEYPGVAAGFQQRLVVSGRVDTPDEVFASRSGSFRDFTFRSPIVDDDALGWRQAATRLNRLVHLGETGGHLVAFSEIGEGVVTGDTDRILRPGEANPSQSSFNGAAAIPQPLNVNTALLYVQSRGSVVRDLMVTGQGVDGDDISVTASHLLRDRRIISWTFQQTPDPIVWMVCTDQSVGTALLSVTYNRKQGVVAWARHDTGTEGTDYFLSVACVPEAAEGLEFSGAAASIRDVVYVLVVRGTDVYLERATDREATSPRARVHLDSSISTEQATTPATLGGGAGTYTLDGLDHLEGREVAIAGFLDLGANSDLVASVASPATALRLVTGGSVSLTDDEATTYYGFAAGLPIICDLETLDIDTENGRTLKEKAINITRLGMWVEESRSFWAGPSEPLASTLDGMARVTVDDASQAPLTSSDGTGYVEGNLLGRFAKSGRTFIRHVDPTPLTVLAVMPMGKIGG